MFVFKDYCYKVISDFYRYTTQNMLSCLLFVLQRPIFITQRKLCPTSVFWQSLYLNLCETIIWSLCLLWLLLKKISIEYNCMFVSKDYRYPRKSLLLYDFNRWTSQYMPSNVFIICLSKNLMSYFVIQRSLYLRKSLRNSYVRFKDYSLEIIWELRNYYENTWLDLWYTLA